MTAGEGQQSGTPWYGWREAVEGTASFHELAERLQRRERTVLPGLPGSLATVLVAALIETRQARGVLALFPDAEAAGQAALDFSFLLEPGQVSQLPDGPLSPYEDLSPSPAQVAQRHRGLRHLAELDRRGGVVVAPAAALALIGPGAAERLRWEVVLEEGGPFGFDALIDRLLRSGYERTELVQEPGEFAVRGGLIDIVPTGHPVGIRVEFWGDRIESLREFSLRDQRATGSLGQVRLLPAHETMLDEESLIRAMERAGQLLPEGLVEDTPLEVAIRREEHAEGLQWYLPLLAAQPCTPADMVPPGTVVAIWDQVECRQVLTGLRERAQGTWERMSRRQGWLPPQQMLAGPSVVDALGAHRPGLDLSVVAPVGPAEGVLRFTAHGTPPVAGDFDRLRQQIRKWHDQGIRSVILVEDHGQRRRLIDLLGDEESTPELVEGQLAAGFVWPEAGLALWPDHEIFRHPRRRRPPAAGAGVPLRSWRALTPGDLVVHIDHGIGQYRGLRRLEVDGRPTELLELHYARHDRLLVPIDQMDRVQRYVGGDQDAPPPLHALGSAAWERTKQRARRDLLEMAQDLARLYAARQAMEGTAYQADDLLMEELEASFPYTETPDQIRAVQEVKRDLESPRPMDRLICGDVGYGKTEVAIRAALKVIEGGAQVAVLVPTTLLAQQHLETFRERLGRFPVRIEMLSRFRSPAQQRQALEGVARGEVDLVIGTHRLLSRDVRFARLGLVVLDEEHRFGVKAKESLRRMRLQADVLSLTATPIPRTLHMSLLGLRDFSTIITPPHDRLPVHTEVVTFEEALIAEAIRREIDRGGQVFFVHNRVRSIPSIQRLLTRLVPEARLGIAHGQMRERALERVMLDFSAGHIDVLIASMIVESGLDLPHANTLIVNRADRLGLAQLYQLRGRVGRSSQKAYAYFLVPQGRSLNRDARRRLQAIQEYADLGAGLHLALRDLEIRGAGNLLGAQQHGHIAAVGLDLYKQMLDEAVAHIQGTPEQGWHPPVLEIPAAAYLPDSYVTAAGIRVSFYRRAVEARSLEDVVALYHELRDRFGPLPDPALTLIDAALLRVEGAELGLDSVVVKDRTLEGRYPLDHRLDRQAWQQLLARLGSDARFDGEQPLRFRLALKSSEPVALVREARNRLLNREKAAYFGTLIQDPSPRKTASYV